MMTGQQITVELPGDTERAAGLLHELKQGSMEAFDLFYEKYASLVYHIALKMTKEQMEAEDICHDVFLEVFRKIDEFDPSRGSVESWLAVKTRSRTLDWLRKKRRMVCEQLETSRIGQPDGTADPIGESVLRHMEKEQLRAALERIPSSQRTALYGKYFESKTQKELSEKLNYPLGTVKSLIRYGINNLRKQFNQLGWLEPTVGFKEHD